MEQVKGGGNAPNNTKASAPSSPPAAPPPQPQPQTAGRRGSKKSSSTARRNSRNQQQQQTGTPTNPPSTPAGNNTNHPGSSSATPNARPTLTPQSSSARRKLLKPSVEKIESRGIECVVHRWDPPAPFFRHNNLDPPSTSKTRPTNGVCCVYHGLAGHARFPTVRYLAEILALKCQFVVYGIDFPGHGLSPGVRGYISSAESLIEDGLAVAEHARRRHPNLPLFLAGSSMGGAVAMSVSLCFEAGEVSGLVLLAPMIKIDVPRWQRNMLRVFSKVSPQKALIPCSDTAGEHQFRDPVRRREVNSDKLAYSGNLRVASAYSCMKLYAQTRENLGDIHTPFLCLVAENDEVVDNTGAEELLERCRYTKDKTLKCYDGALHGLLCEPQPLRGRIERDIVDWMTTRARREWKRRDVMSGGGGGGGSSRSVRAGGARVAGGSDRSLSSARSGVAAAATKRRSSPAAVPPTATVSDLAASISPDPRGGVPAKTKELRDAFLSDLEDALNM